MDQDEIKLAGIVNRIFQLNLVDVVRKDQDGAKLAEIVNHMNL